MNSGKKWQSRLFIVLAGFALGYLARFVYPPEKENLIPTREFSDMLTDEESISDLPILPVDDNLDFPIPTEIP